MELNWALKQHMSKTAMDTVAGVMNQLINSFYKEISKLHAHQPPVNFVIIEIAKKKTGYDTKCTQISMNSNTAT